jgi:hypothetical protein
LAIAQFLRAIVGNTPLRITPEALFWSTVVLGGFGVVAGMAVEAVRQLQASNPEPEYHRRHNRRGGPGMWRLPIADPSRQPDPHTPG